MTSQPRVALFDVNVLLALVWDQHQHHRRALQCFAERQAAWATTPITEAALVRLLLTPQVVGREVAAAEALAVLRQLRAHPGWRFLGGNVSLTDCQLDSRILAGAKQVTDLYLVEIARRADAVLITFNQKIAPTLTPADRKFVHTW